MEQAVTVKDGESTLRHELGPFREDRVADAWAPRNGRPQPSVPETTDAKAVHVGVFNWSAPIFGHYADRWSDETVSEFLSMLLPGGRTNTDEPARLLDVGGGTGALARRLHAASGADVTVLDPTPQMLRYLPDHEPVTKVLGSAEQMPFQADTFDALLVTDAFHHFRDQSRAVNEFARVVRGGGRILIMELDPRGAVMRLIVAAEKLVGEPGAFFTPEQMCEFMAAHGIEGECTPLSRASYRYLGTVRPSDQTADQAFQR